MSVKLLTKQHLECLSLTGGFTGSSESIHGKMPYCWKSHVAAHFMLSTKCKGKSPYDVVSYKTFAPKHEIMVLIKLVNSEGSGKPSFYYLASLTSYCFPPPPPPPPN